MEAQGSMEDLQDLNETLYVDRTQQQYFKNKLIRMKMDIVDKLFKNKEKIKTMRNVGADVLDQSNNLVAIEHEISSQERDNQKLKQIDAALRRIEDGSYGYCKMTGMPIGVRRLDALPYTAVSIEALQAAETWH